jgi:hypothetical protein
LKAIHSQKLHPTEPGGLSRYRNLAAVLARPIDWDLIAQQYDQMVKYATAMKMGTADTEDIPRRFTRKNLPHPTYRALAELGQACSSIPTGPAAASIRAVASVRWRHDRYVRWFSLQSRREALQFWPTGRLALACE